jgi:hypothetical protein
LEIGLHILYRNAFVFLALGIILCAGCAASSSPATQADPGLEAASYSNFLVIGVAGDYNNRAYFERSVVSGIRAKGSSARAFHVVAPGNKPVTREDVIEAIAAGGFDAVVVTRVLDTDTDLDVKDTVTDTKVTRKDGSLGNLFRYDYEDMDEPMAIEVNTRITFATELYDATSEQMVWSAETTGRRSENIGVLIDETSETVVNQLDRNDFIRR